MKLILASNSPRRKELLEREGLTFEIVPSRFEEAPCRLPPKETALSFACGKAKEVFSRFPKEAVLGADTLVALGDEILGKPKTADVAREMLLKLQGRTHIVYTGVCLLFENRRLSSVAETKVRFFPLSREQIEEYIETKKPFDKAGAYGIQDGYPLVEKIEGSVTNVIGLPMELVREYLKEAKLC